MAFTSVGSITIAYTDYDTILSIEGGRGSILSCHFMVAKALIVSY